MQLSFFKKSLYTLLLCVGLLGVGDTLVLLKVSGINLGVVLPGVLGFVTAVIALARLCYGKNLLRVSSPGLRKAILLGLLLWFASFVLIEGAIISGQHSDEGERVDYLLILGSGLKGQEMSLTLQSRMQVGLRYLKQHPDLPVVVSGGQGFGEDISEAEAMSRYLVANGIPASRIVKEERATSTIENLKFSRVAVAGLHKQGITGSLKPASPKPGSNRVMLVTSEFHMFRSKMLAKRIGMVACGLPTRTPAPVLLNCYLREYFAVLKSFVLDR